MLRLSAVVIVVTSVCHGLPDHHVDTCQNIPRDYTLRLPPVIQLDWESLLNWVYAKEVSLLSNVRYLLSGLHFQKDRVLGVSFGMSDSTVSLPPPFFNW